MPFAAEATRTGARIDSRTPLWRQASSSASEISSPSRYFVEHVVVGLGGGLEQLVAPARDLVGELGRDRDLDLACPLEPVRLAMDEVDVAAERLRGADREVERRDLVAERGPQRVERGRRVRVLAVALVEHEAGRRSVSTGQRDRRLEAGLDAARGVHDDQRGVGGVEALDHLGHEVGVAGRVDEGDLVLAVLERGDRQAQRPVRFCSSGS